MIERRLTRIAQMDRTEIAWRGAAAVRTAIDRIRTRAAGPHWSRAGLLTALDASPDLSPARRALAAHRWDDAQRELARCIARGRRRFVIAPAVRTELIARVRTKFPAAAERAAAGADRIAAGAYDLLGYRGLRFGYPVPDWHLDPVAGRRAPRLFWADVPYLDPACGDHKVIWELNRHQHFVALGRAWWLTGDDRYRARFLEELRSWLDANPPLVGVNWASMLELAFRSLSWVWAINLFVDGPAEAGRSIPSARNGAPVDARGDNQPRAEGAWLVDLLAALDRQLAHVERNLSYYFSPNTHLLGEALGLYVCGHALPLFAASARRAALGRRILLDEIDRQIGADGGHAERSTHYHRYALDFYILALVVARLNGDAAIGSKTPWRGWPLRRGCLPTIAAACPTLVTTTAARCSRSPAARRTTCVTAWRSPRR